MSRTATDLQGLGMPTALANSLGDSVANSLTALAGGGVGGTNLTGSINNVTVVASAGDSCMLPLISTLERNQMIYVRNSGGSNSMNVFPNTGDSIDGGTATTGQVAIAAGRARLFFRISNTGWLSLYGS